MTTPSTPAVHAALPISSRLRALIGIAKVPFLIRNWPTYLLHYARKGTRSGVYVLRSGTVVRTADTVSVGTIAVVVLRRHYGSPRNLTTIVDIGANIGVFSLYAASLNPSADVYSFEPDTVNYDCLCRNIGENKLVGRIHPIQLGIAAKAGDRSFSKNRSPTHVLRDSVERVQVPGSFSCRCITLADALNQTTAQTADLVKLNCEGAEYEILYGCSAQDFGRIREIRLEHHNLDSHCMNGRALSEHLKTMGFCIRRFDNYSAIAGFTWATNSKLDRPIT